MSTISVSTVQNGIDVAALHGIIETVRANPAAARTQWTVNSHWVGGARADHFVEGCLVGGQKIDRRFVMQSDEPLEILGTNQYPNPQEYLLAGVNACMIAGYAAIAALMGIKLTHLEVRTWGEIDLRGFLQIDPSVTVGYELLQQTVTVAGDATAEQFRRLHETVKEASPNYYNITHAIAMQSRLVIE